MYEDGLMWLVVFCRRTFLCALCIPNETPSARGDLAFRFPFGFCGVVNRRVCSSARHVWEWTGFGTWHQSVRHSPGKGHGFYSSSAIYRATCTGELGEILH